MIRQIGKYEFKDNLKGFEIFKKKVPNLLAVNSVNHFQEGFRKGGFQTDDSLSGWQKRQSGTRRQSRAILVDAGILWRDIKKKIAKFSLIVVGTSAITNAYADRHNRGLSGMLKREFIGDSKKLTESNLKIVEDNMNKVMNI